MSNKALDRCMQSLQAVFDAADDYKVLIAERAIDELMKAAGPSVETRSAALDALERAVVPRIKDRESSAILSYIARLRRGIEDEDA
jgi:mRNA-degrading endonuclease RelE of RelBE toxin-antitoxin system